MNISELNKKFNTEKKCIAYLEKLRWGNNPVCPYCGSDKAYRRSAGHRWHCNGCKRDYTVRVNTIFEDTRLSFVKWFQIIMLVLNAKKGIASKEIKRNLDVSYKTAWYCQMRIRCAMVTPDLKLEGMTEMDESYFGGKAKHKYKKDKSSANISKVKQKRGRGAENKVPVVGIVEKKGKVSTKVIKKLSARNLLSMLKRYVKLEDTLVITDGYKPYKQFDEVVEHIAVTHKEQLKKKGILKTNTIEGFWSLIKNGIKGSYKAISKKYLPFYLIEYQYKYNNRHKHKKAFEDLVKRGLFTHKDLENYKPVKPVRRITNPRERKNNNKNRKKKIG